MASSITLNGAEVSDGSAIAYGDALPGEIGRQGRESLRIIVATSSYSSACSTGTSRSSRARSPTRSPRSTSRLLVSGHPVDPPARVAPRLARMTPPESIAALFAPSGTLRASINLGNPILAQRDAGTGEPIGVSVDLARELARRLGVPIELVVFPSAAASVDAVRAEQADIGFFAIDPARGDGLLFTAPYVLIEGSYLVRDSSPLTDNGQVDGDGHRISVVSGSAYDLFLTREISRAEVVRFERAAASIGAARDGDVDVAAGIRRMLETEADREPGVRVLPGRFMVIQQAMGTPASRGTAARAELAGFVEEMKAGGFVADALSRHGIEGATVAPAAG